VAVKSWSIDHNGAEIDVTGMDDAGVAEFLAGITEWTAQVEGFATGTVAASVPGTAVTAAVFKSSSTAGAPKFTGTGFVNKLHVGVAVEGAVEVSISIRGSGALTYGTTP